jgi:site-specific DNA-methyltransferase (adenine-specific)
MPYYPQGLLYRPGRKERKSTISANPKGVTGYRPSHVASFDFDYVNYPNNVLPFSNPNNNMLHPTQKPVALLSYLIQTYTLPGETVLDFTMGSGSTLVACVSTGRKGIGIEMDEEFYTIACKRITAAQSQTRMNFEEE